MLRSLLSAHGVNPQMITVFIDGYYEVPRLCSSQLKIGSCELLQVVAPLFIYTMCLTGANGCGGAVWAEGGPAHSH